MDPPSVRRKALALAVSFLAGAAGCPGPGSGRVVLRIGDAPLTGGELGAAESELARAFPAFGRDTLRWHLLEFGMGAAAVLHHRHAEESRVAREEADAWAARLRAGADFAALARERLGLPADREPSELPANPNPATLGARTAAAVAALEAGEWAGPYRTQRGWEIVKLVKRYDALRSRANVVVQRLVFEVGGPADWEDARQAWHELPLTGDPDCLRAVPEEFRSR